MKLNLLLITSLLVLPSVSNSNINLSDKSKDVDEESVSIVEKLNESMEYDTIINNGTINVDYQDIAYYVTFEDNSQALSSFKEKYKDELATISVQMNLSELTDSNYEDYYLAVRELTESKLFTYETINEMLEFFDIYENLDINNEIKENVTLYNTTKKEVYAEQVDVLSANYNPTISNLYSRSQVMPMSLALPNLNGAVSYAKKYAVNANPLYHSWGGADCTNFVSQVLNAGGVGMVTTNNENTGWWYKSSNQRSISWIRADTFSRYMGRVAYKNSSVTWNSFVGKLKKGDFIGSDNSGDGSVDHMAFITDKSGSQVQIAQHSTNYLKWSNSTGWATNNNNRVLYIVR